MSGKLVIVPTPIGNLGDTTMRALDALRAADAICAEDTRVTSRLLAAFAIHKRLERADEATLGARVGSIVERVLAGEVIAYCTDAGMPGVSDPGLRLVAAARAAGAPVEVLAGASAVTCAYVASACVAQNFFFGGFFPRKASEQRARLEGLRALDAALIFYESPKRLCAALDTIAEVFACRQLAVCRELTKLHEEVVRGTTGEVRDIFHARAADEGGICGEIVLVIDAPTAEEAAADETAVAAAAQARAEELAEAGLHTKDIAARLVEDFGLARNAAYKLAMEACD